MSKSDNLTELKEARRRAIKEGQSWMLLTSNGDGKVKFTAVRLEDFIPLNKEGR